MAGSFSQIYIHAVFAVKGRAKKKTFKEEYLALLNKYEIPYEEKFLFEWL
tara:strand:- start:12 stop:161 length:150 start_codon:yes stop_codon:yes gene_type:complete